jgi:competence protein ComEC
VSAAEGAARELPDLRLAGFAVGTWLSALLGLYLPAPGAAAVAAAAGAGAGLLVTGPLVTRLLMTGPLATRPSATGLARRGGHGGRRRVSRSSRARAVAAVVLLGAALGAAVTAARVAQRDAEPVRGLADRHSAVQVELVVTDDPRPVRGAVGRPATYAVPARLRRVWTADLHVTVAVRVLVLAGDDRWRGVLPGQVVTVPGRLVPPRGGDLRAAVVATSGPPALIGVPSRAQRIAGRLRAGLQAACAPLPDGAGGLLPGLVVGDTSRLDPAVEADFRAVGLTHLTAVSGSNCLIIMGAVLLVARAARAGPRTAAVASFVALVGFVVLARPSPSVLRAAAMGTVALIALGTGRHRAALPALGAAVVVLVAVDPELAGSPGFALSVLATSGLLLLAPGWRDALRARGVPAGAAEAVAVPAAAQVACAPVVAGLSGTVSLIAVPVNLLAVPAVAPATVLGVAAATVSPVWAAGAEFLAWLGSWPAWWLVTLARHGATVPSGALPWPGGAAGGLLLGAVVLAVLVAGRWPVMRRLAAVLAVAAVAAALPVRLLTAGWPPPAWLAVTCDVGQGDAVVLSAGAGAAVVVDAGPDPATVDRCLRRLGVDAVPLLVISHFHADHIGGLAGVFRGRAVTAVATTAFAEPAAGRETALALARAAGAGVTAVGSGWTAALGQVRLSALQTGVLRGTRSDANNNSLIVRAEVAGRSVLLAGDAETEQQRVLLDTYGAAGLRADVLKLAHHGSAFQDPAFLDAVGAGAAVVSVGSDNGYGHPNPSVLAHLARRGTRVVRTDRAGDVAVVIDRSRLALVARGVEPGRRALPRTALGCGPRWVDRAVAPWPDAGVVGRAPGAR